MIGRLFKFEFKNLIRDRMTLLIIVYPLIVAGVGKWLLTNETLDAMGIEIMVIILAIISGFLFGASAGFSILDDRDDHVFISIQISPLNVRTYVLFKVIFVYLMSIVSAMFILIFVNASDMSLTTMFTISALSAFQAPIHAFMINAFASNKVEGFVTMKASGFLLIFTIASYFFLDWKEWLFAIAPASWAAKAVQSTLLAPMIDAGMVTMNLPYWGYIGIGFVYNMVLAVLMYRFFRNKAMR